MTENKEQLEIKHMRYDDSLVVNITYFYGSVKDTIRKINQ